MSGTQQIVTVDGPAGSGKSTVARLLADRLGWVYLDTGAMYRAVGLAAHEAGIDASDGGGLGSLMGRINIAVRPGSGVTKVFLNGREVTGLLRAPHVTDLASRASAFPVVRREMVGLQREMGRKGRIVTDGRDMGTVVFPEASAKFFLVASLGERASRRHREMIEKGEPVSFDEVRRDMEQRDRADTGREESPLVAAADAFQIDTTDLGIEEVLEIMLKVVKEKMGIGPQIMIDFGGPT